MARKSDARCLIFTIDNIVLVLEIDPENPFGLLSIEIVSAVVN
jgi:hypothetical protein